MNNKTYILSIITLLLLSSCDASISINNRSGTIKDDYVAEPLSDRSKKYKPLLETSNNIVQMISKEEYEFIYLNKFDDVLKRNLSQDEFISMMNQIKTGVGAIRNFKELQRGFFSGKDKGMDLIYSVKIVEHETQIMKYLFVFEEDGGYSRIVGFHVKAKEGVSLPGQY